MLISDKQRQANQANAKLSTGPRTPEGKNITRLNAVKHMLYTNETVVYSAGETDQMWHDHCQTLIDDLRPQDAVQTLLVHDIASCTFRLQRIHRMESGHLDARCQATYNATITTDTDGKKINKKYDGYPHGENPANARLLGDTAAQVTTCTKLLPDIWRQEVRLRTAWQKSLKLLQDLQSKSAEAPVPVFEPEPAPEPEAIAPPPPPAVENQAQPAQNKQQAAKLLTLPTYPLPFQPVSDAWRPEPKPVASTQPAAITAKQSRS